MSDEFTAMMRSVGTRRVFTKEEELKVSRQVAKGDAVARNLMAEHNMRLVVSISKRYARHGFSMEDLFQEGCVGLMKAVDRFDPEKGYKFSTYATWWIKQAVHRYMGGAGGNAIRVPGRLRQMRRSLDARISKTGESLEDAAFALDFDLSDSLEAMNGPRASVSLDASIGEDGSEGRHASIADPNAVDPAEVVAESHSALRQAMANLPPRQREILELRFGFDGPVRGRNEIAAGLEVGPQVIQKEQARALAALDEDEDLAAALAAFDI